MKRFLVSLLAVALAHVACADDSYLYWMVNTSDAGYQSFADKYSTVQLVAVNGSEWASGGHVLGSFTPTDVATQGGFGQGFYSSIASYGSGYTYYVELLADSSTTAHSSGLDYAAAIACISTVSQWDVGGANLWLASDFVSVPEPTSGLMMLLGLAALALRRRRHV